MNKWQMANDESADHDLPITNLSFTIVSLEIRVVKLKLTTDFTD